MLGYRVRVVDHDEEGRLHWLTLAFDIIKEWEQEARGPILSSQDAAMLARRIANGLREAAENPPPPRPPMPES